MLQEDATYCLYNLSVAAHGHTHPVSTYVDHTPTFHIAPLAPATQLPQSHSAPHTQPLTHTHTHITRSQPRTPTVPAAPLPAMLRYESPSNAASGAHRPFPKELHAGTQLTLSQTRSRCRSPHSGAHTHTQRLTKPGTMGHTPVHQAPRLPQGRNRQNPSLRAWPQGCTHGCTRRRSTLRVPRGSHLPDRSRREVARLTTLVSGLRGATRDARSARRTYACALKARAHRLPAVDYISQKPQGRRKLGP